MNLPERDIECSESYAAEKTIAAATQHIGENIENDLMDCLEIKSYEGRKIASSQEVKQITV